MMKKHKAHQHGSIQQNTSTTVSSLWNDSYHYSYQSAGSFSESEKIMQTKSSRSSTLRSLKTSSKSAINSIRNSAFSKSRAWCFQQCSWCMTCYESKLIAVEPIVFMIMFAVYLQKIVFELYSFNRFAQIKTNGSPVGRDVCYSTPSLNNATLVKKEYEYYGMWNNRTGDWVETETGLLIMTVGIASGILSIIGTLLLGSFSNCFGRKAALVTIITGMLLQAILTSVIIEAKLDLHLFVLAFSFRGLTGGVAGIYTLSYSYITEVSTNTKKKWHAVRIGIIETLSFLAVSLGFIFGGLSINSLHCDFEIPAYLCIACLMSAFLYALVGTPESYDETFAASTNKQSPLPKNKTQVFTGPKSAVYGMFMLVRKESPHCKMWLSFLVMMITVINSTGMSAIITLFLLNEPLAWSPVYIGSYLGMVEFVRGLVLVVVLPWLLSSGVHDITIVTLSMLLTISMNVALGFVKQPWQLFLVGIGQSSEVLIVPTLRAVMSKAVSPEERSALFSFVSVAQLLSSVLGYAVYVPIYIHDWHWYSVSTPFFVMAGVYVFMLPLLCALGVKNEVDKQRHKNGPLLTEDVDGTTTNSSSGAVDVLPVTPAISSVGLASYSFAPKLGHTGGGGEVGGGDGGEVGGGGGKSSSSVAPLVHRSSFDVSIGQDVAEENSPQSDWMVQSYSSLSEYHSNR